MIDEPVTEFGNGVSTDVIIKPGARWLQHAWFLEITFVRTICVCMFVCLYVCLPPRL